MILSFLRKKFTGKENSADNDQGTKTKDVNNQSNSNVIMNTEEDLQEMKDTIYDLIRTIKDPEKPNTLEELNVVYEEGVQVNNSTPGKIIVVRVEFNPTVPHCSLATLIGLCIRIKLERCMPYQIKLDIYIKEGAHTTEHEINKQINDKERIAAAMENPNLKGMVENCIKEED